MLQFKRAFSFALIFILFLQPISPLIAEEGEGGEPSHTGFSGQVSEFDGSLSYTYPIKLPAGRNGLTPDLNLTYRSNNTHYTNHFGQGWSIDIPSIERVNRFGVEDLYTRDVFFSSLDGELIASGTNNYVPRVERGAHHSYTFSNDAWTITSKQGTVHVLGSTTASRQDDPADSTRVYKWMITSTEDTNGNTIAYNYFKDRGDIYLDEVSYNQSGYYTVEFNRNARTSATSSRPGFAVYTGYEIDEILIKADDSLVNEYDLSITDERLIDITRTGHDGASNKSLPATEFTYADNSLSKGWSYDNSWDTALGDASKARGSRFGDVNGDGLPDAVISYEHQFSGISREVMLNTGAGWSATGATHEVPTSSEAIFYSDKNNEPGRGALSDLNGDGLIDYVVFHHDSGSDGYIKGYLNNGTNWVYDPDWYLDLHSDYALGTRYADVNGDGLPDILVSVSDSGFSPNHQQKIYLNTGHGWEITTDYVMPADNDLIFWINGDGPGHGRYGDINGDGLLDLIAFKQGTTDDFSVYISTSTGWAIDGTWNVFIDRDLAPAAQFADINGDRLADLVVSYTQSSNHHERTEVNTGHGWSSDFTIPTNTDLSFWNLDTNEPGLGHLADVDGNGIMDLVLADESSDEYQVYLNDSQPKRLMKTITNHMGGETTYSYSTPGMMDSSNEARIPLNVVETVATDDANGTNGTTTYAYEDADFWFSSSTDKRFAGFGEVTETSDSGAKKITRYHQANGASTNEPGDDSYAQIGRIYEKEITDSFDDTFKRERVNYSLATSSNTTILIESVLTRQYDGETTPNDKAVGYTYDSAGNVLTAFEYGEVNGSADGSFTDTGTDKRTTTNGYTSSLNLVATSTVTNNSGSKVAEIRNYYDNNAHGSASVGNLTKQEDWASNSTYVARERAYNSYGLPTTITDERGNDTTLSYDIHNFFVATRTNAEGHVATLDYDVSSGEITSRIDTNGHEWQTTFDPLDRPTAVRIPDPNTGSLVDQTTYTYTDTAGAVAVQTDQHLTSSIEQSTYQYFDGFGRLFQERVTAPDGGFNVRDFIFTDQGLLAKESLPYHDIGNAKSSATTDTDLYTEYTYDPLDRITEVSTAVGDTTTTYTPWQETVTDALNNDKDFTYDAFGRLSSVVEHEGMNSFTTRYQYDARDNLTKITDASSNVRNLTYDGRSQRLTLEDLHDSADTSFGSWSFAYDAAGNLATTTDPNGDTAVRTYDDINRVLTEDHSGSAGIEISYTYDNCQNGAGRECIIETEAGSTTFAYNPTGWIETETKTIDGTEYDTSYAYDRQGNETSVAYPDGSETEYIFNAGNKLESVAHQENGQSQVTLIDSIEYAPHGLPSLIVHTNGVTTTRAYDADALYRLTSIVSTATTTGGSGGPGIEHALIEAEFLAQEGAATTTAYLEVSEAVQTVATSTPEDLVMDVPVASSTEAEAPVVKEDSEPPPELSLATGTATSGEAQVEVTPVELADPDSRVLGMLKERSQRHWADLKANEIGKMEFKPEYQTGGTKLEILAVNAINGGMEALVRAWQYDQQLGFGSDGSVDIERFRIFNPPILVPDERSNAEHPYREDLEAALISVIGDSVDLVGHRNGRIEAGKVGNTTSVLYPDQPTETSSVDGDFQKVSSNWNTARASATSNNVQDDGTTVISGVVKQGNGKFSIYRGAVGFDTSVIGATATVTSATLSLHGDQSQVGDNDGKDYITVSELTLGSDTALAVGDYNDFGAEVIASSERLDLSSDYTDEAYNDFTLNANGEDWIDVSGTTVFGLREGHDFAGEQYAGSNNSRNWAKWREAAGLTTEDPKLTVVHEPVSSSGSSTPAGLQSLSYTYDAVGNITKIVDNGEVTGAATTTYGYDDLYRLTSAEREHNGATDYDRTYVYDAIGNITSKTGVGSYTYAEAGYANPHAVTAIGGVGYAYDRKGNLASTTDGLDYTWSYRNEILSSDDGTTTVNYVYDHTGQRTKKDNGTTITLYPNPSYEVASGTAKKQIYAGEMLVATVEGSGGAAKTYHNHLDHLNSSHLITDGIGALDQTLLYYPFGSIHTDNQLGSHDQTNRFTGHDYDTETDLSYMGARYQDGEVGRFYSQDPVALAIGDWEAVSKMTRIGVLKYLMQPQKFNTYAYAGNNPLRYIDPQGEDYWEISGTIAVSPYEGSIGLKIDFGNGRVDFTAGAGGALGASGDVSIMYNPGDLPQEHAYITEDAELTVGAGLVGKVSSGLTVSSDGQVVPATDVAIGLGGGGGFSSSASANLGVTLIDFSSNVNILKSMLTQISQAANAAKEHRESEKEEREEN